MRTEGEIGELERTAIVAHCAALEDGSKSPGLSYEEGVLTALQWVNSDYGHPFDVKIYTNLAYRISVEIYDNPDVAKITERFWDGQIDKDGAINLIVGLGYELLEAGDFMMDEIENGEV